ncbi:MAG: GntR family transcriptional regulator [Ruminococcaceae bacterium]|nr:GntR family transcriptional regulator [Oscillospiraceae bacterium]
MAWNFNNREAMFLQIADHMRLEILNGVYAPDQQIPSVRQLAFTASVNPNTMQRALAQLEEEGLLYARGTVGRFVSSDPDVISAAKERMRQKTVRRWIREATALGISVDEMISYIQKEENEQ